MVPNELRLDQCTTLQDTGLNNNFLFFKKNVEKKKRGLH